MFLFWLRLLLLAAILVVVFLSSATRQQTIYKGALTWFGKRTGKVKGEGLRLVWPFFGGIKSVSYELTPSKIEESSFSQDNLEITIKGEVFWIPDSDPDVFRDVFLERSDDAITRGLAAQIHEELGSVAGTQDGEKFIKQREAISLLLNAILRLESPFDGNDTQKERFKACTNKEKAAKLKQRLDKGEKGKRSRAEKLFGIEVKRFSLADVSFSKETTRAFEMKRQEKAKKDAAQYALELQAQFEARGMNPREARVATEIQLSQKADRKAFSLEGLSDLKGVL